MIVFKSGLSQSGSLQSGKEGIVKPMICGCHCYGGYTAQQVTQGGFAGVGCMCACPPASSESQGVSTFIQAQ
jgi:hypothetical protein